MLRYVREKNLSDTECLSSPAYFLRYCSEAYKKKLCSRGWMRGQHCMEKKAWTGGLNDLNDGLRG